MQKLAESRRLKTEPPTIFIDLRQTEPSEPQEHQSQERYRTMLRTVSAGGKEGHKAELIWVEHLVPSLQKWQEAQWPLSFGFPGRSVGERQAWQGG